jgi:hypothetical protein
MKSRIAALALLCLTTLATFATPAVHAQAVPPGGTIYAFDQTWTTTLTPADLPEGGRFDTLYMLGPGLAPVSDAAPGYPGYNGGRWEVRAVAFTGIGPRQFTNASQVREAAARGEVTIGPVMRRFVCPLHRR